MSDIVESNGVCRDLNVCLADKYAAENAALKARIAALEEGLRQVRIVCQDTLSTAGTLTAMAHALERIHDATGGLLGGSNG